MKIKKANKNVFDVFIGDGWKNWTRFELVSRKGNNGSYKFLKKLAGQSLSPEHMALVKQQIGV